ncbi:S8 family peptidase [Clostridium aminobutyricum]|uniref:S8 family peptidase n=1 Tax=Clostridium aminobutyricum TaxID=33953 RepID=A0A939DBG3_CLOAM|nr:S8 family peptidase [Clostridium aminobutyricum]MBN7774532.1 S8 family peptidase [Clostridium aminobutyricum]
MNSYSSLEEFIDDPDTVDFVVRRTEYFDAFAQSNPNVLMTQTLSGRYVIGYANPENYELVRSRLGASAASSTAIPLGLLDAPNLEAAGIIQLHQPNFLNLTGRGVLIGIVDTGIDYTLDVFRREDGTSKIQYIFDQTTRGNAPAGFYIGTEYTNAQINEALNSENPYEIVPQTDTVGHGTFLASVAAGSKTADYIGAAPDADLIVVKLKGARPYYRERFLIPPDQPNAFEATAVMIGVEYVLIKARELNLPVVICLGIGTSFGTHDGFSIFEEYLTDVSSIRGVCVCTAAGNEAQAKHHTQGQIAQTGATSDIDLQVGDSSGSFCLSLVTGISDRVSISLRSPTGELINRIPARAGIQFDNKLLLERTRVTVNYFFPFEGNGGQLTFIRIIDPTPGVWTITVYGDIILDGTYHAWLPITGFVSPETEFLAATPYYTAVLPSTMPSSLTSGAYNTTNNSLYLNSSWGPSRSMIITPDLVAPGVNVGGYYPSGYGAMTGTSVAAAITAGASALLMQWGIGRGNDPALSTYQIKAYLIRGCTRNETLVYPNNQWGYGRLNLLRTFTLLRDV